MAAKKHKNTQQFDAFISYSRKDRDFAVKLEKALEKYKPPKIAGVPQRPLKIFRDEDDLVGTEYYHSIEESLSESGKLILICSPHSRQSKFVNDEIRRFAQHYKATDIIPILLDGIPNNEAKRGDKNRMAFPDALCELMELPLAISFVGTNWRSKNITKGKFKDAWYTILANIYDISREKLEERDRIRQRRRLRIITAVVSAIFVALVSLTIWAVLSEKEVRHLKYVDNNFSRAKLFEERAGQVLREQSREGFQKAWLYTIGALGQDIPATKSLSVSRGRLLRQGVAAGAGVDQLVWVTPRAPGRVAKIAVNPEGDLVATLSDDGTVLLWDVLSGEELGRLRGHSGPVTDIAFSYDGRYLASSSRDSTIRLWKITHRDSVITVKILRGHNAPVVAITFPPGKGPLISADKNGTLRLWQLPAHGWWAKLLHWFSGVSSGERLDSLLDSGGSPVHIRSLAASASGVLAAATTDDNLYRWDLDTRQRLHLLEPPSPGIYDVAFGPDGALLTAASQDGSVYVWNVESGEMTGQLTGHTGSVRSVMFSRDGTRIVSGSDDATIRIWRAIPQGSWEEWKIIPGHRGAVRGVVFAADGRLLVSGSTDHSLRMWNSETGDLVARTMGHISEVNGIAVNTDSALVASASNDGTIILWDIETGKEVRQLRGHGNVVLSVAFSPDGKRLASGGKDKTIRLWDVKTGRLLHTLMGHGDHVWSVGFSPDGKWLVSGSKDETIKLWDVETGILDTTLSGHRGGVNRVVFSHDGSRLASAGNDSLILLWDMTTRAPLFGWRGHPNIIWSLTFSPNDTLLATSSKDESVRLWDMAILEKQLAETSAKKVVTIPLKGTFPVTAALSENGKENIRVNKGKNDYLVSIPGMSASWRIPIDTGKRNGHDEKKFMIWEVRVDNRSRLLLYHFRGDRMHLQVVKKALLKLEGHTDDVWDVAFSPDGKLVASASDDESIRLWSAQTGGELARLNGHENDVFSVAFTGDGARLVSGSFDGTVRIWDVQRSFRFENFVSNKDTIRSVALSPNDSLLAYVGHDRRIHLLDMNTRKEIPVSYKYWDWSYLMSVAFHPTYPYLAYGAANDKIRLWNYQTPDAILLVGHAGDGLCVAFSPDGQFLVSGSSDGNVRVWRMDEVLKGNRKEILTLGEHTDKVRSVVFAPHGRYLASASSDRSIIVWKVSPDAPWQVRYRLVGHTDGVWGLAFSPNGSLLASASWDGQIRLWNMESGDKVATLRGHRGPVLSVLFVSDSLLLSGSLDKSIRLWNVRSGQELDAFMVHNGAVYSLALSSDRRFLVSGSADKTIRIQEFRKISSPMDSLGWRDYRTVFKAYLSGLPFRLVGMNLVEESSPHYFTPVNGYRFPEEGRFSWLRKPRPMNLEPVEWVLKTGEEIERD